MTTYWRAFFSLALLPVLALTSQTKPRARDLGVPFDGTPGQLNAITDVAGVEVGHATIIRGQGALKVGEGPVRTGVTAVLPRGKPMAAPVFAGWFSLNGNGEMTGTTWVEESGFLDGPVMITNTHSVGVVRDAVIAWRLKNAPPANLADWWALPVVAETWDGPLNDINGFHVKPEHAFQALDTATGGQSDRRLGRRRDRHVLPGIQGRHRDSIAQTGRALGRIHRGRAGPMQFWLAPTASRGRRAGGTGDRSAVARRGSVGHGQPRGRRARLHHYRSGHRRAAAAASIEAPGQAGRPGNRARRIDGPAMVPATSSSPSRRPMQGPCKPRGHQLSRCFRTSASVRLFEATVQATEEAVINAMVAAETMTGANNRTVIALPHDKLRDVLKKYNRLNEAQ